MKEIIITTQEQLDKLTCIEVDEKVTIDAELRLGKTLEIKGHIVVNKKVDMEWGRHLLLKENSSAVCWENSRAECWGNSSAECWENSRAECWENSRAECWENSSAVCRGNSSAVCRENSSAELFGFSVGFLLNLKCKIQKKSKYAVIQKVEDLGWFERNGVEKKKEVILYKRVSKDFKTQEGTKNETTWTIGSVVTHPYWNPKENEAGEGKFHACSKPYFCDEFRSGQDDRYIAISIKLKDLYEWEDNPKYPHKIGFREGKVLYECDRFSKSLPA